MLLSNKELLLGVKIKGGPEPLAWGPSVPCRFFFFQAEDGIRDLTVTGVQTCALPISPTEYGVWFALLRIFLLMSVPSIGLQIVFAQQTAAAVTELQSHQLARAVRATAQAMFVIWLFMALVAVVGQQHWIVLLTITNPAALWATVLIGLAS